MKAKILQTITLILWIVSNIFGQGITILPGAKITVQNGAKLKTTGTAGISIQSSSSGTGSFLDQNTSSGNVTFGGTQTVQRYLIKDSWHLISAPISNATAVIFLDQYLRPYDEADNHWDPYIVSISTPLPAGEGFVCWPVTTQAYIFSGTLNSGTVEHDLDFTASNRGNNLVGNPYPSAIDWTSSSGWTRPSTIGTSIWVWKQSALNYATYNATGPDSTNGGSRFIPVGQGFFVQATGSSPAPNLLMSNAVRLHSSQAFLKNTEVTPSAFRMSIFNSQGSDEIVIRFNLSSSWVYDPQIDTRKMFSYSNAPEFYSSKPKDEEKLSINVMPQVTNPLIIPIGLHVNFKGTYYLGTTGSESFPSNVTIYLEDLQLNKLLDLRANPDYTFASDTTDNPSRFLLHFSNYPYGVGDPLQQTSIKIYSFGNSIYIKGDEGMDLQGDLLVYDLLGRNLYKSDLSGGTLNKFTPELTHGYYLVKVMTTSGVSVQKVFID